MVTPEEYQMSLTDFTKVVMREQKKLGSIAYKHPFAGGKKIPRDAKMLAAYHWEGWEECHQEDIVGSWRRN